MCKTPIRDVYRLAIGLISSARLGYRAYEFAKRLAIDPTSAIVATCTERSSAHAVRVRLPRNPCSSLGIKSVAEKVRSSVEGRTRWHMLERQGCVGATDMADSQIHFFTTFYFEHQCWPIPSDLQATGPFQL